MWGEPAAAEAGMALQEPEACCGFSLGSCPWITGPWQWQAAQSPGMEAVDSDLCLHTDFLVTAAAALVRAPQSAATLTLYCLNKEQTPSGNLHAEATTNTKLNPRSCANKKRKGNFSQQPQEQWIKAQQSI